MARLLELLNGSDGLIHGGCEVMFWVTTGSVNYTMGHLGKRSCLTTKSRRTTLPIFFHETSFSFTENNITGGRALVMGPHPAANPPWLVRPVLPYKAIKSSVLMTERH